MPELFDVVDALIENHAPLPPPAERKRLREAHGLSQEQVAKALRVRRATVMSWENGKTEPRSPQREAYARLLSKLAERYPAPGSDDAAAAAAPGAAPAADVVSGGAAATDAPEPSPAAGRASSAAPAPGIAPAADAVSSAASAPEAPKPDASRVPGPAAEPGTVPAAQPQPGDASAPQAPQAPQATPAPQPPRPAAQRRGRAVASGRAAGADGADPRFAHGPLAVLDGAGAAYCADGLVLDCPDRDLPSLISWALTDAHLGAPRLHRSGKDADPLLVLTAPAAARLGLPDELADRRALRLPESHPVVKALGRADWRLTRRGFGPWARVYRPAEGGRRRSVQLAVLPWDALDTRAWRGAADLPPAELAAALGTYASRVLTPCGSAAVTGLELMTALRPPTRAVRDPSGGWVSGPQPGSLTEAVACAPPEAPDGHPVLASLYPPFHQRTPDQVLDEEAYQWSRPLTDAECMKRYLVGIDVNMAFAAAANRLNVGLGGPEHVTAPDFDPALPGSWLVDLSHIEFDPRLPSPFTPHGGTPEGPAWYATPTVAYAVELGHRVAPAEAYVRRESGPYLDAWYTRLRDAYLATMAELGVDRGMAPAEFLDAMAAREDADPVAGAVLSAIKATVKGGIGKLRERPRGGGWRPGEPWPALARPTWRPDIRAAVISAARVNMHRKMLNLANTAGLYPVAILSDCAVYPSDGPSPLDVLPYTPEGKPLPGGFRIGVSPGMVKHEGTRTTLWAEGLIEEHGPALNVARHIRSGLVSGEDDGR
ncbi:helix-turn-helix transcriptional regulator [Streptomyces sp. NPDC047002]|uniref:telomere-associated protein Tap n=1 Tax=Streptomyces sp. NPDC047002 TaxID=3155475 RepID=UPI0034542F11